MLSRGIFRRASQWNRILQPALARIDAISAKRSLSQQLSQTMAGTSAKTASPQTINSDHAALYSEVEAPQCGFTEGSYKFARYFLVQLKKESASLAVANDLIALCQAQAQAFTQYNATIMVGLTPQLWNDVASQNGLPGLNVSFPASSSSSIVTSPQNEGNLVLSQQAEDYCFWVQLKSQTTDGGMFQAMLNLTTDLETTAGTALESFQAIDSSQERNATVLDHFQDGYSNGTSKAQLRDQIINDDGSTFALFQLFNVRYGLFSLQSGSKMEETMGRTMAGELAGGYTKCAHNRRNRIVDPLSKLPVNLFRVAGPALDPAVNPDTDVNIAFNAFAPNIERLELHVANMLGRDDSTAKDSLLDLLVAQTGGYFYVPGALHMSQMVQASANDSTLVYPREERTAAPINQFLGMGRSTSETNPYLFFSSRSYMYEMSEAAADVDSPLHPPSYRILKLLSRSFDRWHNAWYYRMVNPAVRPLSFWLENMTEYAEEAVANSAEELSIMQRKGLADKILLSRVYSYPEYVSNADVSIANFNGMDVMDELVFTDPAAWTEVQLESISAAIKTDVFRLEPQDLLAGTMPDFGLGRGKRSMPYIYDGLERETSYQTGVDEHGEGGHIVPNHRTVVTKGISGILADIEAAKEGAVDLAAIELYDAMKHSWEGVMQWFSNHASLAGNMASDATLGLSAEEQANLAQVQANCQSCASGAAPSSFHEALQLVYGVHCCFHLLGDLVSVGKLDGILGPFYAQDVAAGVLSEAEAQEMIDAFWIKMSEKTLLNHEKVKEYTTIGTTAITGRGGNFDQGGGLNQWVHQVTVGGDNWNDVTLMCLRAARRLPVNAPCLSLRVPDLSQTTVNQQEEMLSETVRAIKSGGAHPILFNDSRIRAGLIASGVDAADVDEWCCDGCYEPLVGGQTKFFFMYVWPLMAVNYALNEGCDFLGAGSEHLRGNKWSYETAPVETWYQEGDAGWEIFVGKWEQHMTQLIVNGYRDAFSSYKNTTQFSPSPMLSSVVDGCLATGRDYTDNGAKYNIFSHFYQGMSVFIDSMYAIKALAFDENRRTPDGMYFEDLAELRDCLKCNWGENMAEPTTWNSERTQHKYSVAQTKYKRMRERALGLSRFGMGWPAKDAATGKDVHIDVDRLGHELFDTIINLTQSVKENPSGYSQTLAGILSDLNGSYPEGFEFVSTPGCGNFEGYCGTGAATGASADGRLASQAYASDGSASPVPADLEAIPQRYGQPLPLIPNSHYNRTFHNLFSWNADAFNTGLSNAVPVDMNVREDIDDTRLRDAIVEFSRQDSIYGSSLLTLTCANPDTYGDAANATDSCDLLRVRQGGWSEHYCVLWDAHKNQHQRRPFFFLDENVSALRWLYENPQA